MSLVTIQTVFDHVLVNNDVDQAEAVVKFGPQAEERMRTILTPERGMASNFARIGDFQTILRDSRRGRYYDEIVEGDAPWVGADKDRLAHAETLYAFAEAMPQLNLKKSDDGGYVRATGFDQTRVSYQSEAEIAQTQAGIKTQAVRLAEGLLDRHDLDDRSPTYVL